MTQCFSCDKEATWVNYTQFAGNHFYCDSCAKEENDFLEMTSISNFLKDEERSKKRKNKALLTKMRDMVTAKSTDIRIAEALERIAKVLENK